MYGREIKQRPAEMMCGPMLQAFFNGSDDRAHKYTSNGAKFGLDAGSTQGGCTRTRPSCVIPIPHTPLAYTQDTY